MTSNTKQLYYLLAGAFVAVLCIVVSCFIYVFMNGTQGLMKQERAHQSDIQTEQNVSASTTISEQKNIEETQNVSEKSADDRKSYIWKSQLQPNMIGFIYLVPDDESIVAGAYLVYFEPMQQVERTLLGKIYTNEWRYDMKVQMFQNRLYFKSTTNSIDYVDFATGEIHSITMSDIDVKSYDSIYDFAFGENEIYYLASNGCMESVTSCPVHRLNLSTGEATKIDTSAIHTCNNHCGMHIQEYNTETGILTLEWGGGDEVGGRTDIYELNVKTNILRLTKSFEHIICDFAGEPGGPYGCDAEQLKKNNAYSLYRYEQQQKALTVTCDGITRYVTGMYGEEVFAGCLHL